MKSSVHYRKDFPSQRLRDSPILTCPLYAGGSFYALFFMNQLSIVDSGLFFSLVHGHPAPQPHARSMDPLEDLPEDGLQDDSQRPPSAPSRQSSHRSTRVSLYSFDQSFVSSELSSKKARSCTLPHLSLPPEDVKDQYESPIKQEELNQEEDNKELVIPEVADPPKTLDVSSESKEVRALKKKVYTMKFSAKPVEPELKINVPLELKEMVKKVYPMASVRPEMQVNRDSSASEQSRDTRTVARKPKTDAKVDASPDKITSKEVAPSTLKKMDANPDEKLPKEIGPSVSKKVTPAKPDSNIAKDIPATAKKISPPIKGSKRDEATKELPAVQPHSKDKTAPPPKSKAGTSSQMEKALPMKPKVSPTVPKLPLIKSSPKEKASPMKSNTKEKALTKHDAGEKVGSARSEAVDELMAALMPMELERAAGEKIHPVGEEMKEKVDRVKPDRKACHAGAPLMESGKDVPKSTTTATGPEMEEGHGAVDQVGTDTVTMGKSAMVHHEEGGREKRKRNSVTFDTIPGKPPLPPMEMGGAGHSHLPPIPDESQTQDASRRNYDEVYNAMMHPYTSGYFQQKHKADAIIGRGTAHHHSDDKGSPWQNREIREVPFNKPRSKSIDVGLMSENPFKVKDGIKRHVSLGDSLGKDLDHGSIFRLSLLGLKQQDSGNKKIVAQLQELDSQQRFEIFRALQGRDERRSSTQLWVKSQLKKFQKMNRIAEGHDRTQKDPSEINGDNDQPDFPNTKELKENLKSVLPPPPSYVSEHRRLIDSVEDPHHKDSVDNTHPRGSIDHTHPRGSIDHTHPRGSIDHTHPRGSIDHTHPRGSIDHDHRRGSVAYPRPRDSMINLFRGEDTPDDKMTVGGSTVYTKGDSRRTSISEGKWEWNLPIQWNL